MAAIHTPGQQRRIHLVFRMDDVSERSDSEFEARLFEVFRRHRVPLMIGVIPSVCAGDFADPGPQRLQPLGEEKSDFLRRHRDQGFLELALHGFSHQTTQLAADRLRVAELAGGTREQQRRQINSGKEILERAIRSSVEVFIPPWNQYDDITLQVLEDSGFRSLCAGENFGPVDRGSTLRMLPATTDLFHLEQALSAARASDDPSPVVIALFHGYDFLDPDRPRVMNLDELDTLLEDLNRQGDVQPVSLAALDKSSEDLSAERYRSSWQVWELRHSTPRSWRRRLKSRYYRSIVTARRHLLRARVVLSASYGALLALSAIAASTLARGLSAIDARAIWLLVLPGLFFLARAVAVMIHHRRLESRQLTFGTIAAGAALGAWLT